MDEPIRADFAGMLERIKDAGAMMPDPEPKPEPTPPTPQEIFDEKRLEAYGRRLDAAHRIIAGGAPKRQTRTLLNAPRKTKALTEAKRWLKSPEWCLILMGKPGTGKTMAAVYAAYKTGNVHWMTASRLMRVGMYDKDAWDKISTAPLLVLDDIGTEFQDKSGSMTQRIDALVDERYSADLKTVITTNLSGVEIKERYGPRVFDRLRDGGRFYTAAGSSMRGKK